MTACLFGAQEDASAKADDVSLNYFFERLRNKNVIAEFRATRHDKFVSSGTNREHDSIEKV